MAIATFQAYQQHLLGIYRRVRFQKSNITVIQGRAFSSWLAAGYPGAGAAPTTAVVPTNSTTGSMETVNDSPSTQRILRMVAEWGINSPGLITVADRLSHQGGLGGTTGGAQTTNLPTAALTRYTGGVGVEMGLEIYTQIGATGAQATASYTNQAGTSGQTTPANTIGGTGFREASRIITMPLATGDTGVKAVASVTLLSSTGTVGNFGVTLYYPLFSIPMNDQDPLGVDEEALFGFGTWFPQIVDNNCLFFLYHVAATSTGVVTGMMITSED